MILAGRNKYILAVSPRFFRMLALLDFLTSINGIMVWGVGAHLIDTFINTERHANSRIVEDKYKRGGGWLAETKVKAKASSRIRPNLSQT